MIEKISKAAEKLATTVSESRRGFLVGIGKAAAGVIGALGGLALFSQDAQAQARGPCNYCWYQSQTGQAFTVSIGRLRCPKNCPPPPLGTTFIDCLYGPAERGQCPP
jgi:hypothetical protein